MNWQPDGSGCFFHAGEHGTELPINCGNVVCIGFWWQTQEDRNVLIRVVEMTDKQIAGKTR